MIQKATKLQLKNLGPTNLDCFDEDESKSFGELTNGMMTNTQQPSNTSDRMNRPSLGRNDPDVRLKN